MAMRIRIAPLGFLSSQNFATFVIATTRADTMGQLAGATLRAYPQIDNGQVVM